MRTVRTRACKTATPAKAVNVKYTFEELMVLIHDNPSSLLLDKKKKDSFFACEVGTIPNRALMFVHPGNIELMSNNTELFVDATYDIVGNESFQQVLVVLTQFMGSVST